MNDVIGKGGQVTFVLTPVSVVDAKDKNDHCAQKEQGLAS